MRPQSCKSKGRRFQQKIARSILEAFPHLAPDDVASTSMGCNGEDVRLSPLAREAVPLSLECKCVEKLNVWSCLEQAQANTPSNATPCLVFSRNRSPSYAVVPWEHLLSLYQSLYLSLSRGGGLPPRLQSLLAQLAEFAPPREEEGGGEDVQADDESK
jgi:hypothetical protein